MCSLTSAIWMIFLFWQAAFAHLALALRCDMFTLKQRVQIEERARNTAEENIQEELAECQAVLQASEVIFLRLLTIYFAF